MIETKVSEQLNVRVQEAEEKANERAVELAEKLRATEKRMQAAVEGMKAAQQSVDRWVLSFSVSTRVLKSLSTLAIRSFVQYSNVYSFLSAQGADRAVRNHFA